MKKLFLGAAIAVSSLSFAQQFGIKGGMNVSSLSEDASLSDQKSKIGFNAGVFMNAPLAENFSIQPEVLYNNLGSKTTIDMGSTIGKVESTLNLDYISVPVMFQYNATPQFYLEAGPEFSYLVNAKSKTDVNSVIGSGTTTRELSTDDFNKFNLGLGLGAGFNITDKIGLNARYVAGFSDVTAPESDPSTDANNKNNTFQVGLNLKF